LESQRRAKTEYKFTVIPPSTIKYCLQHHASARYNAFDLYQTSEIHGWAVAMPAPFFHIIRLGDGQV
jgi:hypothetical protein